MKKHLIPIILNIALGSTAFAITPEKILADDAHATVRDGIAIRKGSIGALTANTSILNHLMTIENSSLEIESSIKAIRENVIGLEAIGVYDLFSVEEWLMDEKKPGNIIVGVLFLQTFPEMINDQIRDRLIELSSTAIDRLKEEILKVI